MTKKQIKFINKIKVITKQIYQTHYLVALCQQRNGKLGALFRVA